MICQLSNEQISAGLAQRLVLGDAARRIAHPPIEYDLPGDDEPDDFEDTESEGGDHD